MKQMSSVDGLMDDMNRRMAATLETLKKDFSGLRTGRASPSLLDPVMVDVYGSMMPLSQVGTVNVPEPRMLSVQVWDKGNVKAVEKGIVAAGLGLNPQSDGTLVRIPLPDLTAERRQELVKIAAKYAEQSRIAIRNVRRDGMDMLKKAEKDSEISEDEHKTLSGKVQTATDDFIKKIDETLAQKEKDITQV
jgi:ribosome recycling factor